MPREQLDRALRGLDLSLLRLGRLTRQALDDTERALAAPGAGRTPESIGAALGAAREVNSEVVALLSLQQPLLTADLYRVLHVGAASASLERVAQHATALVAQGARLRPGQRLPGIDLHPAFAQARQMLHEAMESLVEADAARASRAAGGDDAIDAWYAAFIEALITGATGGAPERVAAAVAWAAIGHELERMGDRVASLCHRVAAMVSGQAGLDGSAPAGTTAVPG